MPRPKTPRKPTTLRAHLAEQLERRVLLSTAVAAFAPQFTLAVGSQPRSVATADVNGDGKLDLLVANASTNTVGTLFSGVGFGAQTTYAVGTTPFSVAAADLNRDGRLDLITANNGSNNVSVLLSNGNGTFAGQTTFASQTQARFVVVGDFNGDGIPDLAVANYGSASVSLLLGNGNGSFQSQKTFSAGAQPASIAIGDFNRDGKLDLAVADKSPGTVSILLGNGSGGFTGPTAFGAGTLPFSVATADLNSDGKLDLVLAEETSGVVGVLLGNGNGSFANQSTFAVGSIPASVAIADINGDGKLDIAAANYSSNSASVLLGNGNGSFQPQKTFATAANPFSLTTADINRDGRTDLLLANFGNASLSVLTGDVQPYVVSINRIAPQSTSASSVTFAITFSQPVTGVDATDFSLALTGVTTSMPVVVTGSGLSYNVTVNGVSGSGSLGLNLVEDGTIRNAAGNPLSTPVGVSYAVQQTYAVGSVVVGEKPADLNGDGKPDLVVANQYGLGLFFGNGDGTFQNQQLLPVNQDPYEVVTADVNGDGAIDLLTATSGESEDVLLGNGDGTFKPAQTISASGTERIAAADVNGDGRVDVLSTDLFGNKLLVALGNGNGTFQTPTTVATGNHPLDIAVGDLNGDGRVDVVVSCSGGGQLTAFLGNGNGTFLPQQTIVPAGAVGNAIADLNGDGRADVVACTGGPLYVALGNGNGTFQTAATIANGQNGERVTVADMNGDGNLDLVAEHDNVAAVYLGNGDGTFQSERSFPVGTDPRWTTVFDFNRDGRPDFAVTNGVNDSISILNAIAGGAFIGQTYTIVPPGPTTYVTQKLVQAGTNQTGASPQSGVTMDSAGNLYGTTQNGGPFGDGTIFKIAAGTSTITTLAFFNGVNGANPFSGVTVDASGNLFGTTQNGGANDGGTVFELPHNSSTINVLHVFGRGENNPNGQYAPGSPTFDAAGNLYGTAPGNLFNGSVFEIDHTTLAVTTLATFMGSGGALGGPSGTLVVDPSGNVFGVAQSGGANSAGGVFEIVKNSGTATIVTSFNGTNGSTPSGGLARDAAGNLFGTTRYGGPANEGTVFEIVAGSNAITSLGSFDGTNGQEPLGAPVLDSAGNLYGTTSSVFAMSGDSFRFGSIFKVAKGTNTVTTLAGFDSASGVQPFGALVLDSFGNLYGTTTAGGTGNQGVVFKYSLNQGLSDIASFDPVSGYFPGSMVFDAAGNIFGTFQRGGASNNGTVFEIPKGTSNLITIASFSGTNGKEPDALVIDSAGNLFGTTAEGNNAFGYGGIFEIPANTSTINVLANFNFSNGAIPMDLILDPSGNLFVLCAEGGSTGYGALSEFPLGGSSVSLVASFDQTHGFPQNGFMRDSAGNFYGVASGPGSSAPATLFKIAAASSTVLPLAMFAFNHPINGGVVMDSAGNLYVTDFGGGTQGDYGSIMELPHGTTTLKTAAIFTATTGHVPIGRLMIDATGNIFGITDSGGVFNAGTIFELPHNSNLITTLASFNGVLAQHPSWGLLTDSTGTFYGMGTGGSGLTYPDLNANPDPGGGTIFKLTKVPISDSIQGTTGPDTITLQQDPDSTHVNWTMGNQSGVMSDSDPNGLTLLSNGGNDVITLDYTHGVPFANTVHLHGAFTIAGLSGPNPLAGANLEIGQNIEYFAYSAVTPAPAIAAALQTGFNFGTWNGSGTGPTGSITSTAAATGPTGVYGIGFADSADGAVAAQPANTVEIAYTVMGDTNLDRTVNSTDAITMARNYLITGKSAWDQGNFNYDSTIDINDANILQKNYNQTATISAAISIANSINAASTAGSAGLTPVTSTPTTPTPIPTPDTPQTPHKPQKHTRHRASH